MGETRTAAPDSEDTDRKGGHRDEPAPTEELAVAWAAVGWAATEVRAGRERPKWAVAPAADVLRFTRWRGVPMGPRPPAGRGRRRLLGGGVRDGPPAGRGRKQSAGGRVREGHVEEAADDDDKGHAALGMVGHAASSRSGATPAPLVQKRLRRRRSNGRPRSPEVHLPLLFPLTADGNPAQQRREDKKGNATNGAAKILSIPLNGVQQPTVPWAGGGGNTKLG